MTRTIWMIFTAACFTASGLIAAGDHIEPVAITMWGPEAELFVEFPPLQLNEKSRFAIHLTDIRDPQRYLPVAAGKVTVRLDFENAEPIAFSTSKLRIPGIFGITVVPKSSGPCRLRIFLQSANVNDTFEIKTRVHSSGESFEEREEPAVPGTEVPFLKEQQWQIPFATAVATERSLRDTLSVLGDVRPRGGGEVRLHPPRAGTLEIPKASEWPVVGMNVTAGEILAVVVPAASMDLDSAQAESEARQAKVELDFARRQIERAERLVAQGAIPKHDLEEARKAMKLSESRVTATRRRLAYLQARQEGTTRGGRQGGEVFHIRAPIAGTLVEVKSVPGEQVDVENHVFTLIDLSSVWIVGRVFEPDIATAREAQHATFRFLGHNGPMTLEALGGQLIRVGDVIDGKTRTVPVVFKVGNQDRRLKIGQFVEIDIETASIGTSVTVPEAAIYDDGGRDIVFVQAGGESFRKRRVQTGIRQRGFVQILSGLSDGERVVTQGGYEVYLQSVSKTIPEHGHAH